MLLNCNNVFSQRLIDAKKLNVEPPQPLIVFLVAVDSTVPRQRHIKKSAGMRKLTTRSYSMWNSLRKHAPTIVGLSREDMQPAAARLRMPSAGTCHYMHPRNVISPQTRVRPLKIHRLPPSKCRIMHTALSSEPCGLCCGVSTSDGPARQYLYPATSLWRWKVL